MNDNNLMNNLLRCRYRCRYNSWLFFNFTSSSSSSLLSDSWFLLSGSSLGSNLSSIQNKSNNILSFLFIVGYFDLSRLYIGSLWHLSLDIFNDRFCSFITFN